MISISPWLAISALTYFYVLPWVLPLAAGIILFVFVLPGWRKARAAHVAAWSAFGVAAVSTLVASPMLAQAFQDGIATPIHQAQLRRRSGDAPRTVAGIELPPHSYVQLDDYNNVVSGKVSEPTDVYGFPVIGRFNVAGGAASPDGASPYVSYGTLAKPLTYRGVPCAPGPFEISEGITLTCTLANDVTLFGLPLRGGTSATVYSGEYLEPALKSGVLAQPRTWFGFTWPAGTRIEEVIRGLTAATFQGPKKGSATFTLPEGATTDIAGRIVHAGIPILFTDGKPDLETLDMMLGS